jgi:hypothetical protein
VARNDYIGYLGVSSDEADALAAHTDAHGVVIQYVGKYGATELEYQLLALGTWDALDQIRVLYSSLRRAAGLQPAEPLYAFVGQADQSG